MTESIRNHPDFQALLNAVRDGAPVGPLCDWLRDQGQTELADALHARLFKVMGRGKNRGPAQIEPEPEDFVRATWQGRHDRTAHPEGEFDKQGRWYPSVRENCDGSGSNARGPSRAWPYSYMLRCRSREHVRNLVTAALAGHAVPDDVIYTPGGWRAWTVRRVLAEANQPVAVTA